MKKILYTICVLCGILSCAEHDEIGGPEGSMKARQIKLESAYPGATTQTRSTIGSGFVEGDQIGLFVVDYEADEPGTPALRGNRASNTLFQMQEDGTWKANYQLFWADKETPADFYAYYPFVNELNSITEYSFSVADHQETEGASTTSAGYAVSDLLIAKQEKVMPTAETVMLQFHHMMTGVCIRLEKGEGFTATEWADLNKTVIVKNTRLAGTVNLLTGETIVNESGEVSNILPMPYQGTYRALLFPQTVEAGKTLVSITIDGQSYSLKKTEAMTFYSGRMHNFTITVDRNTATGQFTFTLADEAITPWSDDADLHEGLVTQYVLVDCKEAGKLSQTMVQMGIDYTKVENLSVKGKLNADDRVFMASMPKLYRLNLLNAEMVDSAFTDFRASPARYVQLPQKGIRFLDAFGDMSLAHALVLPEGLDSIIWCFSEFSNNKIKSIPSTVRYINKIWGDIEDEFRLPEGIEVFGGGYFRGAKGTAYIPKSVKIFAGLPSTLTGTIDIPQGLKEPGNYSHTQCTAINIPEGITEIPWWFADGSELRGEVRIPSTVTKICRFAFTGSKISNVILHDGITEMDMAFNGTRLQGTFTFPKKIVQIWESSLSGCTMLSGIVIPKDVVLIGAEAFKDCYSLNSIVCQAEEPPVCLDNVFYGVPKDNFTVEVPKGCVEKYRNAPGWKEFKRIAEYSNFVCRPAQAQALNAIHTETLVLNADGPWTIDEKPDWVTVSPSSGTGKTQLTLNFMQMAHGAGNRTGNIVFAMTDAQGNPQTTECKVAQYDYEHEEDGYLTLQTATKGNRGGIDIVFLGDGWDGETISNGEYLDLVNYQMESFFAIEPYRSMRDYFNVYVTFPLSQERGVNTMYTYVNNHFGTLSHGPGQGLVAEYDDLLDYAIEKTPLKSENAWRSTLILIPNSTDYTGQSVLDHEGNIGIAICPPQETPYPRDTRGTVQHEAGGHAFGKLGDEAIYKNAFAPTSVRRYVEEMHGRGWYANLATTGKLHDVPWAEFIFDPDYSDRVDVYEGGYGYTRFIYRPEANSCMNYGIPYYNTPSRLAIYKRIKDYAGEEWSMEQFRAQDTFEWGPTTITRSAAQDIESLTPITDGNHQEPTIVRFREVGDKVRAIRKELRKKALGL